MIARFLLQLQVGGNTHISSVHVASSVPNSDLSFATSDLVRSTRMPLIDPLSVSTNDVHAARRVLGVEAALIVLQSEMQQVIEYDGNRIHWKHTYLLAESIMKYSTCAPSHGTAWAKRKRRPAPGLL